MTSSGIRRQLSREGKLTLKEMQSILSEVKKGEISRVMFKNEQLYQYFPRDYSAERMKKEILELLKNRMKQNCKEIRKGTSKYGEGNSCSEPEGRVFLWKAVDYAKFIVKILGYITFDAVIVKEVLL